MSRNITEQVNYNISNYGAAAIVVTQVTLGSWEDLAQGNTSVGFSIRTVDKLPYTHLENVTRHVDTINEDEIDQVMKSLSSIAYDQNLELIDKR